jgi:cellulose synthase/poly-beta-1,6-N-acetylglucosamine synthase-like glycosyltransferase
VTVAATVLFWLATAAALYAWLGYPLVLSLGARAVARDTRSAGGARRRGWAPSVSVVVAAFNEAGVIHEKLRTTLGQEYPRDRLEVVVVSDGSSDGTDEIVRAHPDRRVTLVRQSPRAGKSLALNLGVAAARGDILVFTDADAMFVPGAIARLAAAFADERVGVVSGQGLYTTRESGHGDAPSVGNGYARFEAFLKTRESALGFVASADGAIYAMRRRLYRDLRSTEVNDLLHPIQAALAGYISRFDPGAATVEAPTSVAGQEFRRHVRIIAQGWHIVVPWLPRLLLARRWREAFMLVSHRPVRWLTGLWLVTALAANLVLLERGGVYALTLAGQVVFYGMAATGALAERLRLRLGTLALPYYFCVVSAAGLAGLVRFARGGTQAVWNPGGAAVTRRAA